MEDHAMRIMEYVPILLDRSRVHVPQDTLVMDLIAEVTQSVHKITHNQRNGVETQSKATTCICVCVMG